jgi:hypothetical protein
MSGVSAQTWFVVQSRSPHANGAPASHDALHVQTPDSGSHCAAQVQFVGQLQGAGFPPHGDSWQHTHPLPAHTAGPHSGEQTGGGAEHPPPDDELLEDEEEELDELLDDPLEPPLDELAGGPVSGATEPPHATMTRATTASETRTEGIMPESQASPVPVGSAGKSSSARVLGVPT